MNNTYDTLKKYTAELAMEFLRIPELRDSVDTRVRAKFEAAVKTGSFEGTFAAEFYFHDRVLPTGGDITLYHRWVSEDVNGEEYHRDSAGNVFRRYRSKFEVRTCSELFTDPVVLNKFGIILVRLSDFMLQRFVPETVNVLVRTADEDAKRAINRR